MKYLKKFNESSDIKNDELKEICDEREFSCELEEDGSKYWGKCLNKKGFCIFDTSSYDSTEEVESALLKKLKSV